MKKIYFLIFLFSQLELFAQQATVRGKVTDAFTNEPLPFAAIEVIGLNTGGSTDTAGNFTLNLPPGLYSFRASFVGYESKTIFERQINSARSELLNFRLEPATNTIAEVQVSAQNQFNRSPESPVSLNTLGINEIQRNPGGNQDISKVIQALPGVASTPNFRNDIIIRGGGPNENKFYIDDIEIPAINHFATQGSSGGPVGLINVNFIREANLYTSAFPVEKANALSSVLDIKMQEGDREETGGTFQVGASEVGLAVDGPIGERTTYIVSARRSYLQFLFGLLELPFLPTYNDFQFKVKFDADQKNQFTFIGLGAIDQFNLNTDANETELQQYQLQFLPVNEQWNYTIGGKYTHFSGNGYYNIILSRFMLNNEAEKFLNNDENQLQLLDYQSFEIENKLRLERIWQQGRWSWKGGVGAEEAKYSTSTVDRRVSLGQSVLDYRSDIRIFKYSAFISSALKLMEGRLKLSAGLRTDGNSFNNDMANPLQQLAPRFSLSYNLTDAWELNASVGRYHQLPPYTTLGYRENERYVNEDLQYIRSDHYVLGTAWYLPFQAKLSVEGFYKQYASYPFMLRDSISLANLGSDFGVIGNGPANSSSQGRAYGLEFLYQQKLYKGWFGTLAYTLVRSEFEDRSGDFAPSSWDNGHIITFTAGKKFGKNWELGWQYQLLGGAPYTPYDVNLSSIVEIYDRNQNGIVDYRRLNSERYQTFNRLNLRLDKKWFYRGYSLNVYLDIQNALGSEIEGAPYLVPEKDGNGQAITYQDNQGVNRYRLKELPNSSGTVIPSIGIIIDF